MENNLEKRLKKLAVQLFEVNAIKFGDFVMKSGKNSPIYCDLRVIISYPNILGEVVNLLIEKIKTLDLKSQVICGVPYTALPVATLISTWTDTPMVLRRKEAKNYGTKKLIEGDFREGDTCLIVEDVVTSGASILETVTDLTNAGLKVSDAVVILDREQAGREVLRSRGIRMVALFTMSTLLGYLKDNGCVGDAIVTEVEEYVKTTKFKPDDVTPPTATVRTKMTLEKRALASENPVAKKLFETMVRKQSTLCVAADLTNAEGILSLAAEIGDSICLLKLHADIVRDFSSDTAQRLRACADRMDFLLMEDRKYADIGHTVSLQVAAGAASWADLVTVHSLPGEGALDGVASGSRCGVFLLAEMSCEGNLITDAYVQRTLSMAQARPQLVVGLVCQSPLALQCPGLIQLTPGVVLNGPDGDGLGQRYRSPAEVVGVSGADIAVVGRGILGAANRKEAASTYKKALWDAYLNRIEANL